MIRLVGTMGRAQDDDQRSLGGVLERTAARYPRAIAVASDHGLLTYGALNARVNRVAHTLQHFGLRKGDGVAVFLENRPDFLVIVAAVAKLGAVASLMNTALRGEALRHCLAAAPPSLCIVGEELLGVFDEMRVAHPRAWTGDVAWIADSRSSDPPEGCLDLMAYAANAPSTNIGTTAGICMGEPAFCVFTSGTTGLPKASPMSHKRWIGAGLMFGGVCLRLRPSDTLYCTLPLYHNNALTLCWSSTMAAGAALAIRRRFSASDFWDDCRKYRATAFAYVGEMPRYLLATPSHRRDREHGVRKIVGLGMRPETWAPFKERFGIEEVYEYYSASELNGGFFNILNLDRTVGFSLTPWTLVRFDPESGAPVRNRAGRLSRVRKGQVGLLLTRVTERYQFEGYTDSSATESKLVHNGFEDGDTWVHTGDLMRDIGYGHVQFVDRIGDTFRWKAENVATTQVEAVLIGDPGVADVTVYGVRVPHTDGRAGMAAVVTKGQLDTGALLGRLRRELPPSAVPLFLRLTPSLEVTGSFKHVKRRLQQQGFDPGEITDSLFVGLPDSEDYVPLTPEIHAQIHAGAVRF